MVTEEFFMIIERPREVSCWIKLILHLAQDLVSNSGKMWPFSGICSSHSLAPTTTELGRLEATFLLVPLIHIL